MRGIFVSSSSSFASIGFAAFLGIAGTACSAQVGGSSFDVPDAGADAGWGSSSPGAVSSGSSSGVGVLPGMGASASYGGGAGAREVTCNGGPCNDVPPGLLDPDLTTTWNPGILADAPTGRPLGGDGLPVRDAICASVPAQGGDATAAIQAALDGCKGTQQVVQLAAGTYAVSGSIVVPSGVVLRGAGSDARSGTVLASSGRGPVIDIGTAHDSVCYEAAFAHDSQPLLTQDATKETKVVSVASTSGFVPGDLALVDQEDTGEVSQGDCSYFKRAPNWAISERVEIAAVSGDTLTLTTPLHWTFRTAQHATISKVAAAPTEWAGVERLLVQGGRPGGYPGQHAGGIDVTNAAHCWVKDVQVDGTTSGMPIRLAGTYRCVVRDSHVHNSSSYGFGQDNYGIVLACGAADNLVEDNVARFMNKPIVFDNSGGGNVIGYNYADNSWSYDGSADDGWQELSIDTHCDFPHMELMEGNWAPHMGASTTHGNAGYLTYFRNYASSQWAPSIAGDSTSPIVWSQPFMPQYSNVAALEFDDPDVNMTVVGNVLGSTRDAGLGLPFDLGTTGDGTTTGTSNGFVGTRGLPILRVDESSVAWTSLWLAGNFDTVNKQVTWNASPRTAGAAASGHALPASLYRATRPAWWPAGTPWPWVGPDLSPKVGALPAQKASQSFDYGAAAEDPECSLHGGSNCCSASASCSL